MQGLRAIVKHEICHGLTEDLLIYGQIDEHGKVIWEDQYGILKGNCRFERILLEIS